MWLTAAVPAPRLVLLELFPPQLLLVLPSALLPPLRRQQAVEEVRPQAEVAPVVVQAPAAVVVVLHTVGTAEASKPDWGHSAAVHSKSHSHSHVVHNTLQADMLHTVEPWLQLSSTEQAAAAASNFGSGSSRGSSTHATT